jgi:hypothetical protein
LTSLEASFSNYVRIPRGFQEAGIYDQQHQRTESGGNLQSSFKFSSSLYFLFIGLLLLSWGFG